MKPSQQMQGYVRKYPEDFSVHLLHINGAGRLRGLKRLCTSAAFPVESELRNHSDDRHTAGLATDTLYIFFSPYRSDMQVSLTLVTSFANSDCTLSRG